MKLVGDWESRNIELGIKSLLYSGDAQIARLEWIDIDDSGSDPKVAIVMSSVGKSNDITGYNPFFRETVQTSTELADQWYQYTRDNIPVYIHIIDESDIRFQENARLVIGDAIILMDIDLNLRNKDKLKIVQMLDNKKDTGTGTGDDAIWTDSSKSWTINQWEGFNLIFVNQRFRILFNTAKTLTVQLGGFTLPESGDYSIKACIEWFPLLQSPKLGNVLLTPLADNIAVQTVLCSRVEQMGEV